jgi:hypothetical protein
LVALPAFSADTDTTTKADSPVTLDAAIKASADYLAGRLPENTRTAVINWTSPTEELSNYIIDELNSRLANDGKLIAINRKESELLAAEKAHQLSGEVSDETAAAIGHELGVETVIRGSIVGIGALYRLQLQAVDVETAQISGGFGIDVKADKRLNALIAEKKKAAPAARTPFNFLIGARAGIGIRSYKLSSDIDGFVSGSHTALELAIFASIPIASFAAAGIPLSARFQAEAIFAGDNVKYAPARASGESSFESSSLSIPLLAKFTVAPSNAVNISALAGIYFSMPLSKMIYTDDKGESKSYDFTAPLGFTVGAGIGFDIGPGMLFADIRYSTDFGNTGIRDGNGTLAVYQRSSVSLALGYEMAFVR